MKKVVRNLIIFVCIVIVNGCGNSAIDVEQPFIVRSSLDGDGIVRAGDSINIDFSENIDTNTINPQTIFIEENGRTVDTDVTVSGATIIVKPVNLLHLLSNCSLNITSGVTDPAGNSLDKAYLWNFSTADGQWTSPYFIGAGDSTVRLGMDEKGRALAVWRVGGPIYSSYYTPDLGWSTPESISGTFNGSSPDMAMNPRGDAIAVWQSSNAFPAQIYSNVYIQGRGWQGVEVAATDPVIALYPKVVIDNQGNGFTAWQNSNGVISLSQYTFDQGWGGAQRVSADSKYGSSVALAVNADGQATIAWYEIIPDSASSSSDYRLMAKFYNRAMGWGTSLQLEYSTFDVISDVDLDIDAYGNSIVVYARNGEVYATRGSADTGWELPVLISDNVNWSRNNRSPKVEFDQAGNALLIWADWGGVTDHAAYSKKYSVDSGWGGLEFVSTLDGGEPFLSVDDNGNAIAMFWMTPGIVVNRYLAGQGWAGLAPVLDAQDASPMDLVMAKNGTAILAYAQNRVQYALHFE